MYLRGIFDSMEALESQQIGEYVDTLTPNDIKKIELLIRRMDMLTRYLQYKRDELLLEANKSEDELLTVAEVAKLTKLSKPTIYKMIEKKELKAIEFGDKKQKRIWKSELGRVNKSSE